MAMKRQQKRRANAFPAGWVAAAAAAVIFAVPANGSAELRPSRPLSPIMVQNFPEIVGGALEEYGRFEQAKELAEVQRRAGKVTVETEAAITKWGAGPVTTPWTQVELDMFVKHKTAPGRAARALALVHVAMHDALAAAVAVKDKTARPWPPVLDPNLRSRVPITTRSAFPSEHAAVAGAASGVLAYLFPSEQDYFERLAEEAAWSRVAAGANYPSDIRAGLMLGRKVAEQFVERALNDGASRGWNGEKLIWHGEGRPFGPGYWEPTPPYNYYPPDEPYAPFWKTWLLEKPDQYRPAPPAYGSPKFMHAVQEVKDVVDRLTDEQKRIAKFWVDGHGTVTPAGHWNQIARSLLEKRPLGDEATAELYAYLNMALADAYIAAWDTKYAYWTVRPITAVRDLLGVDFRSYVLTPPFPSYLSGHATFSGAASRILAEVFPEEAEAVIAMGEEAAMSRLYGGIHYRYDNDDGLTLGRKIADVAIRRMTQAPRRP